MGTGEKLTGEQYSRRIYTPQEHYSQWISKTDAYKKWILEYVKKSINGKTLKRLFPNVLTENLDPWRIM